MKRLLGLLALSGCVATTQSIRPNADSASTAREPSKNAPTVVAPTPPPVAGQISRPLAPQQKTVFPEQPKYPDGVSDGAEYGAKVKYDCLSLYQLTLLASKAVEYRANNLNLNAFDQGLYIQEGKKKIANMKSLSKDSSCRVPQLLGFKMKFLLSDHGYDFANGQMTITAYFDENNKALRVSESAFHSSWDTGHLAETLVFAIPNQQISGIDFSAGKFRIALDRKVTASIKLSTEDAQRVLREGGKGRNGTIEYEGIAIYKPYDRFPDNQMYHLVEGGVTIDVKPYKFVLNNFNGNEKHTVTFN